MVSTFARAAVVTVVMCQTASAFASETVVAGGREVAKEGAVTIGVPPVSAPVSIGTKPFAPASPSDELRQEAIRPMPLMEELPVQQPAPVPDDTAA
ncbi:MAG: hypothetical protein HYV03_00825 [Deltaproteobacteria bacterium]|nr:hypothetical protein [Deltaproteobacteria bacterium]